MNAGYPENLFKREPAPPYEGEGTFALCHSDTGRVHVVEADWLERVQTCRLYAYRLPTGPFRPHEVGGYWVTGQQVDAIERVVIGDLLGQHAQARIELRITPSIWPFWRRVTGSTVAFSGSRLRNTAPHPQRLT